MVDETIWQPSKQKNQQNEKNCETCTPHISIYAK